ncbi:MAG: hypothetical protein A2W05_02675 [Candidatus Schekmanbacteria bacterium RBG_16_38_10]|uniref:Glycosyltransferase subfamily 4-like N-terminal domain-containing protein n=1 Tax=Candidatus Schekmanbacteria bacterium RBG_16_38_10 TaxID=1817879 RepID=A0A1F7RPP2_9BACT|nr:MAG: hypothetical protein A2W05_02675 [Candidatus Schekmanbacteria bacterium RBG_16_38_10]
MAQKKLNILQVATHTKIERGGAIQAYLLAKGMKKRGHNVTCVFNKDDEEKSFDKESLEKIIDEGMGLQTYNMHKISDCLKFRKLVADQKFDIIHTHRDVALRFVLKSCLWLKIKALLTNRGNNYRLKREIKAFKSKKLDRIIAVAEAVKSVLVEEGINPAKVEVVYGGFDHLKFNQEISGERILKEFNIPKGSFLVGNIATFQKKKGYPYFFRAASEVLKTHPNTIFIAVGSNVKDNYGELSKELGISDKVIFTGFREDIPEIIAALDLSVCSSNNGEGLTGALRESLAMSKPVISTSIAGNPEIVIDGITGLLVPPRDHISLAKAITFIIENREKAIEFGKKGRSLVMEKCTNEARCERIEKIYYEILQSKGYL